MVQDLKAAPCLSRRGHVDQCQEYAGDNLEHEARERCAAENIKPACGLARNRMFGRLANRRAHLQTQIEPVSKCLDQAHVVSPRVVLPARPGVGISPA